MSAQRNFESAEGIVRRQQVYIGSSQTMYRTRVESTGRILEPSTQKLSPVREATIYPAQFPILLRERLQGKSVAEVADFFGIPPEQVNRLLAGHWRPTKGICQKMGLKVVYALTEQPGANNS